MISIRESLSELEQCHQERDAAVECYLAAINSISHYTLDFDPDAGETHRKYLAVLIEDASSGKPEVLAESRATLRGLLREYRDKAAQYLNKLREELAGSARALEHILDSLAQSEGDHESRVRTTLGKLRQASTSLPEGVAVRAVMMKSADTIDESLEQIRKQHQLTVSQFLVEVGVLHKRIDTLEAAASLDRLTELFNRREMEAQISSAPSAFCLLLARVSGFRRAEAQFRKEVAEELTGAFTKRLRNSLPPSAILGRWGHEEFVAMLSVPVAEANALAKLVSVQLSGAYSCLLAGKTVRPSLNLSVAVVDSMGSTPDRILDRVRGFLMGS